MTPEQATELLQTVDDIHSLLLPICFLIGVWFIAWSLRGHKK